MMAESTDNLQLQHEEVESINAIFSSEVTIHSNTSPISYSLKLRSAHELVEDPSLWPRDTELSLKITYPPSYPEEIPFIELQYGNEQLCMSPIQENSLLNHITSAAENERGMPCILSCYYAAREYFDNLGLVQAALSLLSDDNLSCILSFLATTEEAVEEVTLALPLFGGVCRSDAVWMELCKCRWREKW